MFAGMAKDFGVDAGVGQWVTTLYMLVLGITVPAVTYLMRRFVLKNVIIASFILLILGGVVDAAALNFPMLIAGRILQAISAGITMPMMMSLIMTSVPPERQATAMGISGIAMGFAPNIGPTIGGWMIETTGWRSFFCSASNLLACFYGGCASRYQENTCRGFEHAFRYAVTRSVCSWIWWLAFGVLERFEL